jgi:4-amino-4-deoxy-L-arabinose transferase-like glycosyltransferase
MNRPSQRRSTRTRLAGPGRWRRRLAPLLLLLAVLPLYLAFRSISLDDFDSYSFALALTEFDLALQQPQPPGFPLYIAMGRACAALLPAPVTALTTLSALSGAAAVLMVYGIGRNLDPDHPLTGLLGALCFALAPMSWLTAEKALSDMPGLMWTLLSMALWLHWRGRRTPAPATALSIPCGLVTGLALGVRPQNALPILLLSGESLLVDLRWRRQGPRPPSAGKGVTTAWLITATAGVVGILLWLIPTSLATGGLGPYLEAIAAHAAHVGRADALFSLEMSWPAALSTRAIAFLDTLLTGLAGTDLYTAPAVARRAIVALCAVSLPALIATDWRRPPIRRLGLWTAAVAAQLFLFETLDRPRLFLPLLPWLALLIASGIARMHRPRGLREAITALLPLLLLIRTLPLAAELARTPSPPAQAAAYIEQLYPPDQTLLVAAGSFRAAQVELPSYALLYLYQFDDRVATAAREAGKRTIVILDRDQFPSDVITRVVDAMGPEQNWITLEDRTFTRDRRVHTQHDQVRVQVLTPAAYVPPEMLSLPPGGCIDLGAEDAASGRYLGDGWFRPEEISGSPARWAGGTLTTTLRVHLPAPVGGSIVPQRLRLRALAYPPAQALTVEINGIATVTAPLPQEWHEVAFTLPAAALTGAPITTLTLVHEVAASPFETLGGASSDTRRLTAAYDWLCIGPDVAGPTD